MSGRRPRLRECAAAAAAALVLAAVTPAGAQAADTQTITVDGVVRIVTFESALYPADAVIVDAGGTYVPVPASLAAGLGDRQAVDLTLEAPAGTTPEQALAVAGGLEAGDVTVADVEPTAPAPATPPVAPEGEHTLLVLPVYWTSSTVVNQPMTTWARAGATSVSDFWTAASGGDLTLATTLRDPVQIADPGTCDPAVLRNVALAAHGVAAPTDPRTHVVVFSQYRPDCYVAAATVGGPDQWVNGSEWKRPWVHGFGHTLGLVNSESLTCQSSGVSVVLDGSCFTGPFGRDLMGSGLGDAVGTTVLGAGLAEALGWADALPADPTRPVETDLAQNGSGAGEPAMAIPLADGTRLFVEHRGSRVQLNRVVQRNGVPVSQGIDAGQYHDELLPGAVAVIGTSGYALAVVSVGAAGARVAVTPRSLDVTPPAAPVITSPVSGSWQRRDTSVPLTWSAATDGGTGVAGYRLVSDGLESGAWPLTADRTTYAAYLASGRHTFTLQAVDRAGNVSSTSSVTLQGGTPPQAPLMQPVVVGFHSATVRWSMGGLTTPEVLGYELTLTPGGAVELPAGTAEYRIDDLAPGTYRVEVTARNAIGTSPIAAGKFTVTVPTVSAAVTPLGAGGTSPVKVSWSVGGAQAYLVEVSLDGHPVRWLPPSATELTLPVSPGTHSIVVSIENQDGERVSSDSHELIVAGPAAPVFRDVPPTHPFASHIEWLYQAGITTGYSDGTYRPSGSINRDAMAAFLYRYAGAALDGYEPPATPLFSDVPLSHPFYTEISWLAETGITTGYPDGTFRPSSPVNRDAMAAFLYRFDDAASYYQAPDGAYFDDVDVDHPFFTEISWMADAGISTGWPDYTYRPRLPIARDAMAAFLYRFDHPAAGAAPAAPTRAPSAV